MPTVLLQGRLAAPRADALRERLGADWRVLAWHPDADPLDAFAPLAAEADSIVGGRPPVEPWPPVPRLRLFQIPWTGSEWTGPERMPRGVAVANVYEHETAIAEYVVLAMLEWRIGLRGMDARFRREGWGGRQVATGPRHGEVRGATLGIVGHGHIGHEVALRARALGMRVAGIRSTQLPCPPELDWLGTPERLDELLGWSDFVLLACDLNAATRGLIDAGRLAAMKPGGVLINVARGAVVDEAALYAALAGRRIGGAVIDVWWRYNEPGGAEVWPSAHAFHELDNVICSAHECATTDAVRARRWAFVAHNLERVARGEPPENVLFHGTQVPGSNVPGSAT
ncbi:MAG TPA: 2-hydroxyacid dehydrogenase [Thermohalobaculum sp.]|nr:2-hydroxyacid dehydrogenase [Thermohalobaculum sp.]